LSELTSKKEIMVKKISDNLVSRVTVEENKEQMK
jgi:hypothetical protein